MKNVFLWVTLTLFWFPVYPQKPLTSEYLSPGEVKRLFADSVQQAFKIFFPIRRVYHYADRSGEYYCVLTESLDSITAEGDSIHMKIRAVNLRRDRGQFSKVWELNDFADRAAYEQKIWFWTRYVEFKDYDKDALVVSLIIYGTQGLNNFDDCKIKFLIYYKEQKVGIRYQACVDDCRSITIDKTFYSLPETLQNNVMSKMRSIQDNHGVIYPYGGS